MSGPWRALVSPLCTACGLIVGMKLPEYLPDKTSSDPDQLQARTPLQQAYFRGELQPLPREEPEKRPAENSNLAGEMGEQMNKYRQMYNRMMQNHRERWHRSANGWGKNFEGSKIQKEASDRSLDAFESFYWRVQMLYAGLGSNESLENRKRETEMWQRVASLCHDQAAALQADVKVRELTGEK